MTMLKRTRVLLAAALLASFAVTVQAVEPAYKGPKGNPEEPATRPYKWMWRGVQAFGWRVKNFRPASSFVELGESTARGMRFDVPPQSGDARIQYKKDLRLNREIHNKLSDNKKEDENETVAIGEVPPVRNRPAEADAIEIDRPGPVKKAFRTVTFADPKPGQGNLLRLAKESEKEKRKKPAPKTLEELGIKEYP